MTDFVDHSGDIPWHDLAHLTGGRVGRHDVPCPLCGPSRKAPANRVRRVLRVWIKEPGFASYTCSRCGASGWAKDADARRIDPIRLDRLRREADAADGAEREKRHHLALYLWKRARPIAGTIAETYLRGRGIGCELPATLRFLASGRPDRHPAMIAAFGLADEPAPGLLAIPDEAVTGVHLTLLRPDGSGKADVEPNKLMIGRSLGSVKVEEGDALYLALEDNRRRLQRRLRQLLGDRPKPARLALATECPVLDKGGLQAIEGWCQDVPNPRLIVVDVFAKVRSERRKDEGLYDADYKALAPLKDLADRLGLAIVVVHHTSKRGDAADPFDTISGTTGMTGAADTVVILASSPEGPKLYGRGRDVEEFEKALRFDRTAGQWLVLGDAGEVSQSEERKAVLDVLAKAKEPMTPREIAQALGKKDGAIKNMLARLVDGGEVVKESRGRYRHRNNWTQADPPPRGDPRDPP